MVACEKSPICPFERTPCGFAENQRRCPEYVFSNCDFVVLTGSTNVSLAREVSNLLRREVSDPVDYFSDGEIDINRRGNIPSLRGRKVYVLQTGFPNPNDRVVETLLLIDAAKRASAEKVIPVLTHLPYTRGDRKDKRRTAVAAKAVLKAFEKAGASEFVIFDPHVDQEQGFVDCSFSSVYGSQALLPEIRKLGLQNLSIVTPDAGGLKRARFYARELGADVAIIVKQRNPQNDNLPETVGIIGNVKGKNTLIVDDEIQSASTLAAGARLLMESGASQVLAAAVHGKFTGNALRNIDDSPIEKVFVTNTIEQRSETLAHPKIVQASIAPLVAEAILTLQTNGSLSGAGLIL